MTICMGDWRRALLGLVAVLAFAGPLTAAALDCAPLDIIEVDTSDIRNPSGLVFRVTTADGTTSYLLGTMHVADPRILAITTEVTEEIAASRRFVMEVVLDMEAMFALQGAMFFGDATSLGDHLGEELFLRIADMMSARGVPETLLQTMKPWAVYTTLSTPAGNPGIPLDMQLMMQAQGHGLSVTGLETVAEQVAVFESVALDDQVELLREMACHYDVFQAEIEEMVERYVARDLRALVALSLRHVDASREAFLDALLWTRNERMVERMQPMLDEGGAFIAIGALHLPGARGILQHLERLGYDIEVVR